MKIARRRLVLGALAGLIFYCAGIAWKKRFFFRITHRVLGSALPAPPSKEMLSSAVGTLSDSEKEGLWELYEGLGQTWEMSTGERATFFSMLDLKTEQPPSYLDKYRAEAARFAELRRTQPAAAAARAMLAPRGVHDPGAHGPESVVREFIVLLLMSGGFQRFGLGKYPGFAGGQGGYRLSSHERKAPI